MITDCMRNGSSDSERAMEGRAVLRIVPSRLCMKKAMATTQGSHFRVRASNSGGVVDIQSLERQSQTADQGARQQAGSCLTLTIGARRQNEFPFPGQFFQCAAQQAVGTVVKTHGADRCLNVAKRVMPVRRAADWSE